MAAAIVLAVGLVSARQGDTETRRHGDQATLAPLLPVSVSPFLAAFLALTAGGLIKYLALMFGPVLLCAALRRLPSWRSRLGLVVAGGLYAQRWHRDARRFVRRHQRELRVMPVWLICSGPLDDSADAGTLAVPKGVAKLADRVGARGTQTFGGRLAPDATGFIAGSMAKTRAGDFRSREQVDRFAREVASVLGHEASVGR